MGAKKFLDLFFLIFISLFLPSNVFSETLKIPSENIKKDVTHEYRRGLQDRTFKSEQLKNYDLILVPGFLSDIVIAGGRIPLFYRWGLGEYFDNQMRWFAKNNLRATRVDLESEEVPDHNAELIKKYIENSNRPVIVIAHSKGNVDLLHSLLNYPQLQNQVKGWIALQGAFKGSPVADWVMQKNCLNGCAAWLLKKMGGTEGSLKSLQEEPSSAYLEKNKIEIANLVQKIPTLSFRSFIGNRPYRLDTLLFLTRNLMLSRGLLSDGLVPFENAVLPGSEIISVSDVDHADPVMKSWVREYDRLHMTTALCEMLLRRMR